MLVYGRVDVHWGSPAPAGSSLSLWALVLLFPALWVPFAVLDPCVHSCARRHLSPALGLCPPRSRPALCVSLSPLPGPRPPAVLAPWLFLSAALSDGSPPTLA